MGKEVSDNASSSDANLALEQFDGWRYIAMTLIDPVSGEQTGASLRYRLISSIGAKRPVLGV